MKPYYEKDGITIYHDRCERVLPFLEPVDLLLTDPPYGIGADKKSAHSSIRDNPEWTTVDWDAPVKLHVLQNAIELAESQIIWGGNYYYLPNSSCWLIWEKPEAGTGFSMADAELAWTNLRKAVRVFRCTRNDGSRCHPTQKPLPLIQWCLGFVPDAETILDPFMGSGTTLVAAKLAGKRAIGIEQNKDYCDAAIERLRQGVLPLAM